jgi:folate-binding protein YgfZ
MQIKLDGVAALNHWGVIRVEGDDAAKFLHGQLTQDFLALSLSEARLAAFCSAKGRMQASFCGFKRSQNQILLVCSRDILAATLKRLSMFVMRAKVRLSDASDDFSLYGLVGSGVNTAIKYIAAQAGAVWSKADFDQISLINLYPADGVRRVLWVAPSPASAPASVSLSLADWQWSDVRSGVAMITAPIVESFVPQMLNYESIGGVNFKKGCYPGQEVVARSQFRGILKRRAYLAHSDAPMQSGDEVFQAEDASQPCGMVAQGAAVPAAPEGGFDAIVCLQIAAFEGGGLQLKNGAALSAVPPPYPLLSDL